MRLKKVPDDSELHHRAISRTALIRQEAECSRLPFKSTIAQDPNKDKSRTRTTTSLVGGSKKKLSSKSMMLVHVMKDVPSPSLPTSKMMRLRVSVLSAKCLPVKEGMSMGGYLTVVLQKIYVDLHLTPYAAR